MDNFKIKAEIFKISTIGKLLSKTSKQVSDQRISKSRNDEFGYFSSLDNL